MTVAGVLFLPFRHALMGVWFGLLAVVYGGHAFATEHTGSPMSRRMILYSLRRLPGVWAANPLRAGRALAFVALATFSGWGLSGVDSTAPREPLGLEAALGGACLCMVSAALVSRRARFPVSADLLVGLIVGGHGPQSPPPPRDPSLSPRGVGLAHAAPARSPTIAIFVIDSARASNMSLYGYGRDTTPFLDSLASRGGRAVPLAVSSGAMTESGLWSILSSRRVRHHATNAPCLHDALKAAGYSTQALLSGMHWHSMGLECLYGPDMDVFEDHMTDAQLVERARRIPARVLNRGTFFFFHLMSVHSSADPPREVWTPSLHRYSRSEGGTLTASAREPFVNHYDNAMLQADASVAAIMEALGAGGYLEDAVVVVTSDHGEHVLERTPALAGHGRSLYQESVHIPLLVWDSRGGLPSPAFLADQTDIAPTILDLVGVPPPAAWQGTSIFCPPGRADTHVEHIAGRAGEPLVHMEALISRRPEGVFKTIRHHRGGQETLRRTFCLSDDPGERLDLTGRLASSVESGLEAALRSYREQPSPVVETVWRRQLTGDHRAGG